RSRGEETFGATQDGRALRYASIEAPTTFVGYDQHQVRSRVTHLFVRDAAVAEANEGDEAEVILATTPFYPEGGGQVGDQGEIFLDTGRFEVEDTVRYGESIVHIGRVVAGTISAGDEVTAQIDAPRRLDTARNHTGTHLLHAALRSILGTHVRQ